MKKYILSAMVFGLCLTAQAQEAPTKGFLLPRMTTAERAAMVNPAKGIVIYNTDTNAQEINTGTAAAPAWSPVSTTNGASASKFTNDAANTRVALTNLSDGTTARTAGTEFVVTDAGNVGIGTATAPWPLTISGASASVSLNRFGSVPHYISRHANGTQAAPTATTANDLIARFSAWAYDGTQYLSSGYFDFIAKNNVTTTTRSTDIAFSVANGTDVNEVMRLSGSNGNVGIGTAAPLQPLHVIGNSHLLGSAGANDDKIIANNDPNNYFLGQYAVSGSAGLNINWHGGIRLSTSVGTALQVLQDGNVGIGTTNPVGKLDVNGNIVLDYIGSSHTHIRFGHDAHDMIITDNTAAKTYGGGYFFRVTNSSGSAIEAIQIDENGRIGMGATPTSKLQVTGLPGYATDGDAGAAGLTAGAFYQTAGHATLPNGVIMVKQ